MNIDDLKKERKTIHAKCLSSGFTEEDKKTSTIKGIGCDHIDIKDKALANEDCLCDAYINPSMWWDKRGGCPLASHFKKQASNESKVRLGQQKQKKRK